VCGYKSFYYMSYRSLAFGADSACGSVVLFDQMFIAFALVERKNANKENKAVPRCRRLNAPTV